MKNLFIQLASVVFAAAPVRQKVSVSLQNRIDIFDQLHKCYSIKDLNILQEILRFCTSDFDPLELVELLYEIDGRRELLEYLDHVDFGIFTTAEVAHFYKNSGEMECQALRIHLQKTAEMYNESQLQNFKSLFSKRKGQPTI